eukprot:scaffold1339_cov58-Attheya_sp.AAC.2
MVTASTHDKKRISAKPPSVANFLRRRVSSSSHGIGSLPVRGQPTICIVRGMAAAARSKGDSTGKAHWSRNLHLNQQMKFARVPGVTSQKVIDEVNHWFCQVALPGRAGSATKGQTESKKGNWR